MSWMTRGAVEQKVTGKGFCMECISKVKQTTVCGLSIVRAKWAGLLHTN